MARLNYIILPERRPDGPTYRKGWRSVKPSSTGIGAAAVLAAKRRMRGDVRARGPVVHTNAGPPPTGSRRAEMPVLDTDVVMFEDDYIYYPPIIAGYVPAFHGDGMEIDSEDSSRPSNPSHGVTPASHDGIPLQAAPARNDHDIPRERPQINPDNIAGTHHNNALDSQVVPDVVATNVDPGTPHKPDIKRSYTSTGPGPQAIDDIFGENLNAAAGSTTPWLSSAFREPCHNSPVLIGQDDPFLAEVYYTRSPATVVDEPPVNAGPQLVDDIFGENLNAAAGGTTPWLSSVFDEGKGPVQITSDSPWGSRSGNHIGDLGDTEEEADDTAETVTDIHNITTQLFLGFAFVSISGLFLFSSLS